MISLNSIRCCELGDSCTVSCCISCQVTKLSGIGFVILKHVIEAINHNDRVVSALLSRSLDGLKVRG